MFRRRNGRCGYCREPERRCALGQRGQVPFRVRQLHDGGGAGGCHAVAFQCGPVCSGAPFGHCHVCLRAAVVLPSPSAVSRAVAPNPLPYPACLPYRPYRSDRRPVLSSVSFPSLGRNLRPAPVRNAAEGSVCREGLRQTADAMSCESGILSVFRGQLHSRTAAGREQTLFSAVFSLRPVQCYCIYMALCVSCNELNERPWEYLVCGNMPYRYC